MIFLCFYHWFFVLLQLCMYLYLQFIYQNTWVTGNETWGANDMVFTAIKYNPNPKLCCTDFNAHYTMLKPSSFITAQAHTRQQRRDSVLKWQLIIRFMSAVFLKTVGRCAPFGRSGQQHRERQLHVSCMRLLIFKRVTEDRQNDQGDHGQGCGRPDHTDLSSVGLKQPLL